MIDNKVSLTEFCGGMVSQAGLSDWYLKGNSWITTHEALELMNLFHVADVQVARYDDQPISHFGVPKWDMELMIHD